jgi:Gdp/GTP exchange factor required for growth at low temperatures
VLLLKVNPRPSRRVYPSLVRDTFVLTRRTYLSGPAGVYLSELYRYGNLPDLIDPTAPHVPVIVDSESGNFAPPAHPEVFSNLAPLPPTVQLEPLINVHKQRLIAGVIKSLVSGQHLASRVSYPLEKKLWQKCLRLRGLNGETLQRALVLYDANRDS